MNQNRKLQIEEISLIPFNMTFPQFCQRHQIEYDPNDDTLFFAHNIWMYLTQKLEISQDIQGLLLGEINDLKDLLARSKAHE